jgi:hypothetical protein
MLIQRTSDWFLGTAMAAAVGHFTQMTRTLADAFEPDLDAWEYLPVTPAAEPAR